MLPLLDQTLPRAGRAARKAVASDPAGGRRSGGAAPGAPLHRYRLPRHELQAARSADGAGVVLTLDGRPVGRVSDRVPASRSLAPLGMVQVQRAAREGVGGILLGDDPVELTLLGGRSAAGDPRRLQIATVERTWTVAACATLATGFGIWSGAVAGEPVARLRPRTGLSWTAQARLADVVLLEAVGLRYQPAELAFLLRHLGTPGDDAALSVLSPLGRGARVTAAERLRPRRHMPPA